MIEDAFETTHQVAQRFGVTTASVSRWAREGRFPGAKKSGGNWYIPKPTKVTAGAPLAESSASSEFEYETAWETANRLGVSTGFVIRLVEAGLLEGERGPWPSYAIPKDAVPIISLEERRSRRPDVLRSWRQLRSEKRREVLVLQ